MIIIFLLLFLLLPLTVTSKPGLSQLSPYLNFDPSYLQTTQPEFIALEGQPQTRGRFELAFSQIGGEVRKVRLGILGAISDHNEIFATHHTTTTPHHTTPHHTTPQHTTPHHTTPHHMS